MDNATDFTKNDPIVEKLCSNSDISSTTDFIMPGEEVVQKRPFPKSSDTGPPSKRKRVIINRSEKVKWDVRALSNAADSIEHRGKSPVSVLNELGLRVLYTVLKQDGPAHRPNYTVSVTVREEELDREFLNYSSSCDELLDRFENFITVGKLHYPILKTMDIEYKNPVSVINELRTSFKFTDLTRIGSDHEPMFCIALTVADMTFEGWGHSKREARAAAARACLSALLARAGRVLPSTVPPSDFTQDDTKATPGPEFQVLEAKMKKSNVPKRKSTSPVSSTLPQQPRTEPPAPRNVFGTPQAPAIQKSPINILYESYPGLVFQCTYGDGSPLSSPTAPLQVGHSMRFKVVCQIKNQKFEGYGSSKKLAKLAAARSALAVLEEGRRIDQRQAVTPGGLLPQTLADHIGKLVNETFTELMKGDVLHSKRKVLAGIVITVDNKPDTAKVIAVTTGTKCVSGEHMSVRGRTLNDCHAEVAARRCLQRYLYSQLLLYANSPDPTRTIRDSDVEPVVGGGYQLKADRQVHLYVSTAPCGDGRIFSPHEDLETEPDRHPNRLARGQLRTKIESGEGTIPVKNCSNIIQTWDGVLQGERLLTMSCSDKVARWCVVGLQGALLSHFMRPVYLHSLVLGSLLHPHHMYRATCGRIEKCVSQLPPPFRLERPRLARAASAEARTPARAPTFSVNWCCVAATPEVVNATTGKLESGQPSMLCKQSMFARWHYLLRRGLPLLPPDMETSVDRRETLNHVDSLPYDEAKQLCPAYQVAKQRLVEAFEKAKLGKWVEKPLEQDQFLCELVDVEPAALFG